MAPGGARRHPILGLRAGSPLFHRSPGALTMDCIFCRIVAGEIPSERVHETETLLVFRDIQPAAPTHLLVIPKRHVGSLAELDDPGLGGELLAAAVRVAADAGLGEGWRLIANTGPHGGQEVSHLHFHVLGGRPLGPMLTR